MLTRITPIFYFYRKFLLPSILFNFLLLFLNLPFVVSFAVKALFFLLLLFVYLYTKQKSKLIFYQNLSIRTGHLFALSFIMDVFILAVTYLIFGYGN